MKKAGSGSIINHASVDAFLGNAAIAAYSADTADARHLGQRIPARTGARKSSRPTWEEGWTREARPVLLP